MCDWNCVTCNDRTYHLTLCKQYLALYYPRCSICDNSTCPECGVKYQDRIVCLPLSPGCIAPADRLLNDLQILRQAPFLSSDHITYS